MERTINEKETSDKTRQLHPTEGEFASARQRRKKRGNTGRKIADIKRGQRS